MENNYLFGYSTTIRERIYILHNGSIVNSDLNNLRNWRSRKTLVSDSEFDIMLKHKGISKVKFNKGISKLTENDLELLFEFVKKQEWYQLHEKVLLLDVNPTDNLDTALRFHMKYFSNILIKILENNKLVKFSPEAIQHIKEGVLTDLMNLASKTLVWDVHDIKKRRKISSSTPEREFYSYLSLRFSDGQATNNFFLEYPTLAKLLAARLQFAIKNVNLLLQGLLNAYSKLNKTFKLKLPYYISDYRTGNGDSHKQGKSAIIIQINDVKLVFKYRNNQIGICYNEFMSWIETIDAKYKFYKIKYVTEKDYSFEEFIDRINCIDEKEVISYYTRYGHLLALTYWLSSSDLHMENLIAHGQYPVLIDTETLLNTEEKRIYNNEITKNKLKENSSLIKSGLLPVKKYWKRQLELSALNGIKQKLPYKVRKLVNEKSSDILFQLEEQYMEGSNNIPMLYGQDVNYKNYLTYIEKGFLELNSSLLMNKECLIIQVQNIFKNCEIRSILRDTQDYANFISFATHPSCMSDFIEREKIFENLWSNSFIDTSVIPLEINSLLENDIPLFSVNVSEYSLSSHSETIKSHYKETTLNRTLEHIKWISNETISDSLLLLKESLDMLTISLQTIYIPEKNAEIINPLLSKAADIGDLIINNLTINKTYNFVIWTELTLDVSNNVYLEYPGTDLYKGTSGLFIFFYYLNGFIPKESYQDILKYLELELFSKDLSLEYVSAFYGVGCQLTAAFYAYRFKKDKKFLEYIKNYMIILKKESFKESKDEWIYGKASLIKVLVSLFYEFGDTDILMILSKLTSQIKSESIKEVGFAHGYSGLLYALHEANELLKDNALTTIINRLSSKLLKELNTKELNGSWCNGYFGIYKTLHPLSHMQSIDQKLISNETFYVDNSCLCHGLYGKFEYIISLYQQQKISKLIYEKYLDLLYKRPIKLKTNSSLVPLGLFTGISGIGYQLLRANKPHVVSNILYF